MNLRRTGLTIGSLGVAAAIALGGQALAQAATTPSPTASPSATTGATADPSSDTAVTGTQADSVIAAVKAAFPGSTITTVRMDPDGSFDALGTAADGSRVFYDVSADLVTITAGGHGGGRGGHGDRPADAPTDASAGSPAA